VVRVLRLLDTARFYITTNGVSHKRQPASVSVVLLLGSSLNHVFE
jgi:hypothetical protein